MAGSLARHIGQQAFPALVDVVLDHAGVTLDRGPVKGLDGDGHGIAEREAHLGIGLDVAELAREQHRRGEIDDVAVRQRDEGIGDRDAGFVDHGQLADEGDVEQLDDRGRQQGGWIAHERDSTGCASRGSETAGRRAGCSAALRRRASTSRARARRRRSGSPPIIFNMGRPPLRTKRTTRAPATSRKTMFEHGGVVPAHRHLARPWRGGRSGRGPGRRRRARRRTRRSTMVEVEGAQHEQHHARPVVLPVDGQDGQDDQVGEDERHHAAEADAAVPQHRRQRDVADGAHEAEQAHDRADQRPHSLGQQRDGRRRRSGARRRPAPTPPAPRPRAAR